MLVLLILVYIQFMIMQTEVQKVLSQDLKGLCSKTATVLLEWTMPEPMDVNLLQY
jgi:hypothetical protein